MSLIHQLPRKLRVLPKEELEENGCAVIVSACGKQLFTCADRRLAERLVDCYNRRKEMEEKS